MKKLTAILKGRNFVDKLFNLREREIKRAIEAANDELESKKAKAEIEYERLCKSLSEDDVKYRSAIYQMLTQKEIILQTTIAMNGLKEIATDLESEVVEEEEADGCKSSCGCKGKGKG